MKHFTRTYFGAVALAIFFAIYTMFKWWYIGYAIGVFTLCYLIGYVLDRFGIIKKITEKDDTQKYDDC